MSAAPAGVSHIPPVHGSYPVRSGNSVTPLIDGEAAFTRICEALEAARHSVWLTVAYLHADFAMPGGRGSLFDVLDAARARGLDVRAIFWRTDEDGASHFHGRPEEHAWLAARGSRFLARWDRAQKAYCQHQKSWLIDAGESGETAFVGGINLDPASVSAPGHGDRGGEHIHDVYCELRGPAASDVHHNFVQRWNEASERAEAQGHWPAGSQDDNLRFPIAASPPTGDIVVQIQRSVRAGHYTDGTAAAGGSAYDIAAGERSIFAQYEAAIAAARSTVYIENQYIAEPQIVVALRRALERGVDVAIVCPAEPDHKVRAARKNVMAKLFFDLLGSLGTFDNFVMAGLAAPQPDGTLASVYVHDKIMLIDDHWTTIGSCNIASQSFFCDTELNAAIWDGAFTRALRRQLLREHLGIETGHRSDREALAQLRAIARANAAARAGAAPMQGLAFALDPAAYGA